MERWQRGHGMGHGQRSRAVRGGVAERACVHVERVVVNFTDDRRGASRRVEQHLHFPCRDGSL